MTRGYMAKILSIVNIYNKDENNSLTIPQKSKQIVIFQLARENLYECGKTFYKK